MRAHDFRDSFRVELHIGLRDSRCTSEERLDLIAPRGVRCSLRARFVPAGELNAAEVLRLR